MRMESGRRQVKLTFLLACHQVTSSESTIKRSLTSTRVGQNSVFFGIQAPEAVFETDKYSDQEHLRAGYCQMEVEVQNAWVPWFENGRPELEVLSASSPFFQVTAWATELQLRRCTTLGWKAFIQQDKRIKLMSKSVVQEIASEEPQCKALFLGCREGGGSSSGRLAAPVFLLLRAKEGYFERVGICTLPYLYFGMFPFLCWGIGKEFLGDVQLQRERIKLG